MVLFIGGIYNQPMTFRTDTAALKGVPSGWSDHSSATREKKMASETRSKTVVAPGIDGLFDIMQRYGAVILLFSVLAFFGFVMFNVTTFIPGSAWHVPTPPPAAEAPK
jgi:hypothetical protein